jgi:geranylgeranyl diphosphate synthase, type II
MSGIQVRKSVIFDAGSEQKIDTQWLDAVVPDKLVEQTIGTLRSRIEDRLQSLLDTEEYAPPNLLAAMRHALLGGGKRFRPLIFVMTANPRDCLDAAIDIGCAVEMVHTASLILDDLPCMDDAELRRNKPTTHKAFGQATAILAAISLLTLGIRVLSTVEGVPDHIRVRLTAILSHAVGHTGLAAGQEIDLRGIGGAPMDAEQKNWLKTGKLFAAMADMASILSQRPAQQEAALTAFAFHLGSAFQALDDLMDAIAATSLLGKDSSKDAERNTLVNAKGQAGTRQSYIHHLNAANHALPSCGVKEEPIRFMLRSIHCLVPSEAQAETETLAAVTGNE